MNSSINLKKVFAFLLSLSLILCAYAFSFLQNISLMYLILSGYALFGIFTALTKHIKIDFRPIILIFLLILLSLISLILFPNYAILQKNAIIYLLKLMLWGIVLSFPFGQMIDLNYFFKCVIKVAAIATIYIIIQSVFGFLFSYKLPNVFNFHFIIHIAEDLSELNTYRPASFFGEPAYYSTHVICAIALLLRDNTIKNKRNIIILLTLGILLSTSTSAIYMLIFLYMLYFINIKKTKKAILFILIFLPIISVIILNLNTILEGLGNFGKIFDDAITKPTHFSSIARLGKSYNYLGNLTGMQKYFGCGIGNEYTFLGVTSVYINSMARLIIQSGYIGVILFGAFLIQVFKECKSYIEYFLLILYITKCVSGGAMFSIPGIFILLILKMSNFNSINKKVEVNEHD